jgi:uncharacterized membrane protein
LRPAFEIATIAIALFLLFSVAGPHISAQQKVGAPAAKITISGGWETFTSPEGDFTLSFPGKPSRAPDAQGPVTTIRFYSLIKDGTYFIVNFQDLGFDSSSPFFNKYADEYEELMRESLRDQGQRLIRMRRVARNIVDYEAWQTVKEPGSDQHYLMRDVVHRGRTYQLTCASLVFGKEVNRAVCRRYFSSLRFSR